MENSDPNKVEVLDQDFELFFIECKKQNLTNQEMQKLLNPLKWILWKIWIVKYLKIFVILGAICYSIYYIDFLSWHFCAIGRILMIKALPFWNWEKLYNAKCLIEFPMQSPQSQTRKVSLYEYDCVVCENFGENEKNLNRIFSNFLKFKFSENIDLVSNVSFSFIHDKYLLRGLPVIVTDSIAKSSNETLVWQEENFIEYLFRFEKIIYSNPCDLETNLILNKLIGFDEILKLLRKIKSHKIDYQENWFLHFRNCDFKAVS